MISGAIAIPQESLRDPASGRPLADQIMALAETVEEVDTEAEHIADKDAAVVEKCFWQLWALYEFLASELTRSEEEVEALRNAAWKEVESS